MKTKTVVNGSVLSNTGTGAGSASNPTPSQPAASGTAAPAAVVVKKGLRLRLQEMLSGCQAALPAGSTVQTIPLQGPPLTQAAIVAQLQQYLGNYTALDAATVALMSARSPVTAAEKPAAAFVAQLKLSLEALFGPTSPNLALFGLKPKGVKRQLTATQLAAKTARANNTRTIRGTKGKLQKASLASGPMAVTIAPAAAPAPAAPPGSK